MMNKKIAIGVGVAATLVAAYFIFKPKKKDIFEGNGGSPFEPAPPVEFKCKFPSFPCPNNPMKCYNPLIFTPNQCGNVLS